MKRYTISKINLANAGITLSDTSGSIYFYNTYVPGRPPIQLECGVFFLEGDFLVLDVYTELLLNQFNPDLAALTVKTPSIVLEYPPSGKPSLLDLVKLQTKNIPSKCTCGAQHTSFSQFHSSWCDVNTGVKLASC